MSGIRYAEKAGSWYTRDSQKLASELDGWLDRARQRLTSGSNGKKYRTKAIISPHAGYVFCGGTAAYAFSQIDPNQTKRAFILGPSHHVYLDGCALTPHEYYSTPIGNLKIDQKTVSELHETGRFTWMSKDTDTHEHSIEMQLPFLAHIMQGYLDKGFTIVPILIGALREDKERQYGKLLAKYMLQEGNVFIISSDFCHWGERFNFQYCDQADGAIHKSIERLDRNAMEAIQSLQLSNFTSYLKSCSNTICGRHPIAVLLAAVEELRANYLNGTKVSINFLDYSQSSSVKRMNESSVSYAAASLTFSN